MIKTSKFSVIEKYRRKSITFSKIAVPYENNNFFLYGKNFCRSFTSKIQMANIHYHSRSYWKLMLGAIFCNFLNFIFKQNNKHCNNNVVPNEYLK